MRARRADNNRDSAISKPRRLWLRVVVVFIVLLIVGVLVLVYFLQPTRLTALLLSQASSALKLEVKTDVPGNYALRPEPRLVLPELNATVPGANRPFFRSKRVELALPWDTLRGRSSAISSIVLKSPDIDLTAMKNWVAPEQPSNQPFKFPTLTRGLQISDGTLHASTWQVEHLNVTLPSLADGKPAALDASGTVLRGKHISTFALQMTATPAGVGTGLRLDNARIALKADGEIPSFTASGNLLASDAFTMNFSGSVQSMPIAWAKALDSSYAKPGDTPFSIAISKDLPGTTAANATAAPSGLQVQLSFGDAKRQPAISLSGHLDTGLMVEAELHGQISRWPDAWPGLPAALGTTPAPIVFHASYRGTIFLNDPLVFDVERGDIKLQGKAAITDLRKWIAQKSRAMLPPVEATLIAPQLDINGTQLHGVRIELHDDAAVPVAKPATVAPKS